MSAPTDPVVEALAQVKKSLEGFALVRMKGLRTGSGFTSTGYHDPSYLYGRAMAVAEHHGDELPSYVQLKDDAEEAARARLIAEVAERGPEAFAPANRAERPRG